MAGRSSTQTDDPGVLSRLWTSGVVGYIVGFEVILAVIIALALTLLEETSVQGVIVGMAISLIVLSLGALAIGMIYVAIRDRLR